jgi:hypothetical protein
MRVKGLAWLLLLSLVGVGAVGGCTTEEGVTPQCPPLPLYDVKQGTNADGTRTDDAEQQAIDDAVAADCLSPIGTARSGTAPVPTTGNGGAAGAPNNAGAGG